MKKKLFLLLTCMAGIVEAQSAIAAEKLANETQFALSAEAGTLGWGASGWYTFNESFSATAGYNGFDYSRDVTTSDVNYKGNLTFKNFPVMLGWHPFKGTFRIVAGVVVADNKVTLLARPNGNSTYDINGTTYTSAQVGSLLGTADLGKGVAPYAGIGWSKSPRKKGIGVFTDLGAMFSGSPSVALQATGPISTDATFRSNLAAEVKKVNDEVDGVKIYPVVRFGLMYRF